MIKKVIKSFIQPAPDVEKLDKDSAKKVFKRISEIHNANKKKYEHI